MATEEEVWQKRLASRMLSIQIVKKKPEYLSNAQVLRGKRSEGAPRTPSPGDRLESTRHFRWRLKQWRRALRAGEACTE